MPSEIVNCLTVHKAGIYKHASVIVLLKLTQGIQQGIPKSLQRLYLVGITIVNVKLALLP